MEEKSKRPEDTPFKQQRLKSWQPILTPNWVISTFSIVGLLFIPIGVVLQTASDQVVEYGVQYDGSSVLALNSSSITQIGQGCPLDQEGKGNTFNVSERACLITFSIEKNMKAPIYVYYQLDNFYQNHRRYVQSRSDAQLRGEASASTADCAPLKEATTKKFNSTAFKPIDNVPKTYTLNPCGLIANSIFNDIFWINSVTLPDGKKLYQQDTIYDTNVVNLMTQTGIAWKSDVETKFKNTPADKRSEDHLYLWENQNYRFIIPKNVGQAPEENVTAWTKNASAYGVQDEHFIVWMRTAGLPNFRKLYGKITHPLKAGTKIEFLVSSNFVVSTFEGHKSLVISTTSWFGGRNSFLGIAYIVVGAICVVLAILFFAKHKLSPRKLGDTRYLVWKSSH